MPASSTPSVSYSRRILDSIGYQQEVRDAISTTSLFTRPREPLRSQAKNYVQRMFPFTQWLLHYNLSWAMGDLIAGLTVGIIVVPQGMSYAKIATLPAEYGLYSSFVGVLVYMFFATSKDVTIGPVAVMSLETAKVIAHVQGQAGGEIYSGPVIATALAFICGFIVLGIGLFRLGFLVELIPAPAISGFMTGSALSILSGQVAGLMGYSKKVNTREATYKVIINTLKHLPDTKKDAAFGLVGLFFLFAVRSILSRVEVRARTPTIRRLAFFANTLRSAFAIIFLTLFSWVYLRNKAVEDYPISVLSTVPSGFNHVGRPIITGDLIGRLGPLIPVSTIVLLLEHIAIARSFGRVNNYKIDPSQELIAIGVTNTIGTLFAAYPATGSFSRTAIKSKAGVRTPAAGLVVGIVVVVALYALTGAFYWIPNAGLSAVIIHAVGDLIASPRQVYGFWKVSPLEAIIWAAAVLVSVFSSIENGIYTSVGASAALLLYRIARPRGHLLGRVRLSPELEQPTEEVSYRDVYVPLQPDGVRNPLIKVEPPPPGIIIFRFSEALLYPNASYYSDVIEAAAKAQTRSGQDFTAVSKGDRPWNDPGPLRWKWASKSGADTPDVSVEAPVKPLLRAVVLDFSSVSNVDSTSVQNLVDLRRVLERYAGQSVEFHFSQILSPWIKRALLAGGFGTGKVSERPLEIAPVVPSGGEPISFSQATNFARRFPGSPISSPPPGRRGVPNVMMSGGELSSKLADIEAQLKPHERHERNLSPTPIAWSDDGSDAGPVVATSTPRFHLDLAAAVAAACGGEEW